MADSAAAVAASAAAAHREIGKMSILTDTEKASISAAVEAAEKKTAGELVVVVAKRSHDYATWRAFLAISVTIALAAESLIQWHSIDPLYVVLLQLPVALALYALSGVELLLRMIVPRRVFAAECERRAMTVFLEAGVTETQERSGVLIYLSEAEHRAVILGDRGIHERVEADEWQTDLKALVESIRQKKAAEGLVNAVTRIGGILAEKFPARQDNTNELSNAVIEL